MQKLKVWQKLALMGAVFLLPFTVVAYKTASATSALAEFARQELRGLEYHRPALQLLRHVQQHGDMAAALLNGASSFTTPLAGKRAEIESDIKAMDEVDERLGVALGTTGAWTAWRSACRELLDKSLGLSAGESFERHTRLIGDLVALLTAVGDRSNLTLDPDPARRHLVDVLTVSGPELGQTLARARGLGSGLTAAGASTPAQIESLDELSILVAFLDTKVDRSLERAFAADDAIKSKLETDAGARADAVLDAAGEIVKLSADRRAKVDLPQYFSSLSRAVDSVFALQVRVADALTELLADRVSTLRADMLQTAAWGAAGLLVVSIIGFFIMRDITATLRGIVGVANRIALGDLSTRTGATARRDELGAVAQAFDRMAAGLREMVLNVERIAAGDLAVTITPRSEDDEVGQALARMVGNLSALVGAVHRSGIQVNTSVNEIAATARQQQATASEIAATTTQIGATSKEISATSRELVKTMNDVAAAAEHSAGLAGGGQAGLTRMAETMRLVMEAAGSINGKLAVLNEKAGNINQVVTTITKVADQTNLLSLNAAIEAEKAGEYGRGFAVVATEIRRLADQTAVATYDIEQTVKEIQSAVAAGVMGMDKFSEEVRRGMEEVQQIGGHLSEVVQQVQALAPQCEAVTEGMQAQAAGAEQITQALVQLSEAAQQTVESLRQSGQAIDGLNDAAVSMRGGVSRFKLAA
jgi:methyl-accepting chemotaxis protein WspA